MSEIVKLQTKDDEFMEVKRSIVEMMGALKDGLELTKDMSQEDAIIKVELTRLQLSRVVEWCEYRTENPIDNKPKKKSWLPEWELEWYGGETIQQPKLFETILAANYLEVPELLNWSLKILANMTKGQTCENICRMFGVDVEFTPEEEARIAKEYPWLPSDQKKDE